MIFFKAEANDRIGAGHLHRSIALAKECNSSNIKAGFIFSDTPQSLINKVIDEGFSVHYIKLNEQLNVDTYTDTIPKNSMIVFDTDDPQFYSGQLIEGLHENNIKTACYSINDSHSITTNILLNPNIISQIQNYHTAPYTKQLLGPGYMIFRNEFRKITRSKRLFKSPFNLLLIFGNADVKHLTIYFLNVIEKIKGNLNKVRIVVGELNPDLKEIVSRVKEINNIEIELHIKTRTIQTIYEDTDIAITSAGMAMWEMALYKIPQIVIASSNREVEYVKFLSELNYIHNLSPLFNIYSIDEMANSILNTIAFNKLKELKTEEFCSIIDPNGIKNTIDAFKSEIHIKSNM